MDLCVPMPLMLTVIVTCFPGEIYLGCVTINGVVLCTCILPVMYQVVICFFHFVGQWVTIRICISYYTYYAHSLLYIQVYLLFHN